MRRLTAISLSLALGLTALSALPVAADPDGSNPQAATIVRDLSCSFGLNFTLNDGSVVFVSAVTTDSISVQPANGVINTICHFTADDFTSALPPETVHAKGFACTTFGQLTTETLIRANANGKALMRCVVHA